ncbi:MAG TPA: hypothetical protein VGU25_11830 [Acidobacteriaceae bacterium]|nr:hypothetical protein [Acidobacteriaceae bacterium]
MKAFASLLPVLLVSSSAVVAQKPQAPLTIQGGTETNAATPAAAAPMPPQPTSPGPQAATVAAIPVVAAVALNGPDANGRYMLRDGDDVPLQFAQDISSKTAAEGDPVMFTLSDDLKVNGVVVAKEGSKAVGEVAHAEHSGMMGKPGQLDIRLNYLKVGDTKVHLRGTKGKEGQSGTTSTVVLTVLFGPIGLIKHGKNIDIKQGTSLHAYVSDDTALPPVAN